MNSLQKPCNYYEKYMKYKTKYIEYKNNLMVVNGKKRGSGSKSTLVGGGLNARIAFFADNKFLNNSNVKFDIERFISINYSIYIIVTYILENTAHIITYKIKKKVGSGTSGTVYKLEQIQPSPQSSLNNFVIKLNFRLHYLSLKVHSMPKSDFFLGLNNHKKTLLKRLAE